MADRRQLPPQIRRVELARRSGGKPVVRYQLTVDVGTVDGKRKQLRRRYATEKQVRAALAEIQGEVVKGTYVPARSDTVETAITRWLDGRAGLAATTLAAYRDYSRPVIDALGTLPIQHLTKTHIDQLLSQLANGTAPGKRRRRYKARARRYVLATLRMVLESEVAQGHLVRNVAALVDMPPLGRKKLTAFTADQADKVLRTVADDRDGHAWHLALSGLRRGEIAGLRWNAVDLDNGTLAIRETRVSVDGRPQPSTPKTDRSARELPMPASLVAALRKAKTIQNRERLALGSAYLDGGYVVVDEAGRPYLPDRLSRAWPKVCRRAEVPVIRLHDARHTCATLMHLQGVPIVVISAWLGHVDAGFTMRTYAHGQDDSLTVAAQTLGVLMGGDARPKA